MTRREKAQRTMFDTLAKQLIPANPKTAPCIIPSYHSRSKELIQNQANL